MSGSYVDGKGSIKSVHCDVIVSITSSISCHSFISHKLSHCTVTCPICPCCVLPPTISFSCMVPLTFYHSSTLSHVLSIHEQLHPSLTSLTLPCIMVPSHLLPFPSSPEYCTSIVFITPKYPLAFPQYSWTALLCPCTLFICPCSLLWHCFTFCHFLFL